MKKIFKKICCFLCICVIWFSFFNQIQANTEMNALNEWMKSINQTMKKTNEQYSPDLEVVQKCLLVLSWRAESNGKIIEPHIMSQTEYSPGSFVYEKGNLKTTSKVEEYAKASEEELFKLAFSQAKTITSNYANDNMPAEVKAILNSEQVENRLYAQLIYEETALNYLKESLNSFSNIINTSCNDANQYSADMFAHMKYNETGEVFPILCDQKDDINKNFSSLVSQIQKLEKTNQMKKQALEATGKIGDSMTNFGDKVNEGVDNALDEADKEAQEAQKEAIYGDKNLVLKDPSISVSGNPEVTLENLINRVNKLIGKNEKQELTGVTGLIAGEIVPLVGNIGTFIMFAIILFMGVKCIWSGVEGKAQFKEMLPYLIVGIIFFWSSKNVVGMFAELFGGFNSTEYNTITENVWGTILYIVRILAFAGIIFTGIKILFSNAEGKADAKSKLVPILVGCILVFASSVIVNIIVETFEKSTPEYQAKKISNVEYIEKDRCTS